jgi:hypothetical protein
MWKVELAHPMVAISYRILQVREVPQISFVLQETKGQIGLSSTVLSLSIIMITLEVPKPGSVGGELTQITNLTLSLCINLLQ